MHICTTVGKKASEKATLRGEEIKPIALSIVMLSLAKKASVS